MNDHWNTVLRNTFPLAFKNFRTPSWIIFTFAFSLMSFLKYFFWQIVSRKNHCALYDLYSEIILIRRGQFSWIWESVYLFWCTCIKIKLCLIYCRGILKKSLKGGPCHQSMVLILDIRFLIVKVTFTYRRRINRRVFLILQLKIDCI